MSTPAQTILSPSQRDQLARELANAIQGEVRFGLHDRMLYATDASIYQVEPLGVVIPSSTQDAVRAVEFCAQRQLPILPRGGGTSLAGQCVGNHSVVIDLSSACTRLLELDTPERTCRAEAGMTIGDLNAQIASSGLHFAPDPSTAVACARPSSPVSAAISPAPMWHPRRWPAISNPSSPSSLPRVRSPASSAASRAATTARSVSRHITFVALR